jgi:hypothetical protein
MANSTTIATTTAVTNHTTTITFTSTHTTTQQLAAAPFLGIPTELWIIILPLIGVSVWLILKFQVKAVPVTLLLLAKNYSALKLKVNRDLAGLWLTVINARGKKADTIKQKGKPFEVYSVDNKDAIAYTLRERRKEAELGESLWGQLVAKGFKIEEKKEGRRQKHKGYLIKKDAPESEIVYVEIPTGGMKHETMFTAVEGTGHTVELLDIKPLIDESAANASGSDGVIHQEINAAKSWLQLLGEAASRPLGQTLILLGAGMAMGGLLIVMVFLFGGHFK